MKEAAEKPLQARAKRMGRHLVADPRICHGKVTIKGTRVMAWQIFEALARGEPAASIAANYHGVSEAAIAECVNVAQRALLDADGRPLNGNGKRPRWTCWMRTSGRTKPPNSANGEFTFVRSVTI